MNNRLKINILETEGGTGDRYCTFVSPDVVKSYGLPSSLIVGTVEESDIKSSAARKAVLQSFKVNPEFKKTLNDFCSKIIPKQASFAEQLNSGGDDWIYVVDQRTPDPSGAVPPEDLIGGFEISNKKVLKYVPNPNYRVHSKVGFLDLGEDLNPKFYDYMVDIVLNDKS